MCQSHKAHLLVVRHQIYTGLNSIRNKLVVAQVLVNGKI